MPKFNSTVNSAHVNYNETRAAFGPSKDETLNLSAISSGGGARDRTYTANYADQMRSDTPKKPFQIFNDSNSSYRIASPKNESQPRGLALRSAASPPPFVAPRAVSPFPSRPNSTHGGDDVAGWFNGSRVSASRGSSRNQSVPSPRRESYGEDTPAGLPDMSTNYSSVFYRDGEGPPESPSQRPMMYNRSLPEQTRGSPRPPPQMLSRTAPAGAMYPSSPARPAIPPFGIYQDSSVPPCCIAGSAAGSPRPAPGSPRSAPGSPRPAPGSPRPAGSPRSAPGSPMAHAQASPQHNRTTPFSPALMNSRSQDPNFTENMREGLPEHLKHLLISQKDIRQRGMAMEGMDPNSTAYMRNLLPDHFKHVIPSSKDLRQELALAQAQAASPQASGRLSPIAARQSPVAPRQSPIAPNQPMSTSFTPMFPSLMPPAPAQSPIAANQSQMVPRQSPMAPRHSPVPLSQLPMPPRQSPMPAPARAAPQSAPPRRRSPDSMMNTTQYVLPGAGGVTRFPRASNAMPPLEFQLPPTIMPIPGVGQQAGGTPQHATSLPLAPVQHTQGQRNVMSTSMPLPRREGRTTTERQVTGPQGTTRQTTVTTVDNQAKLDHRKQEFSKYCNMRMQAFLQKHTKQLDAVIKGYKGESQEELNGIINQLVRVQIEELNAFGEDMSVIQKALLQALNQQVVKTKESKTIAPGQVITERTTVEAPAGPEDINIAEILHMDEPPPPQDNAVNPEMGNIIANFIQQQNDALAELELVMKNEMELNPTPETQRKNEQIIKEAKIEFKEAMIAMMNDLREEYQAVKSPAVHERLQQSKGGANDLAKQLHQLLITQAADIEELKSKQQLMQEQNADQDMNDRHEMELQTMRDYHLAQLNEEWEKFQKGGAGKKNLTMPSITMRESYFQTAVSSSPNVSGMQFQTPKQSESQQTSKQQLTNSKGVGLFTAHPVGSENCLCCSCQGNNSCSCGRGGSGGHGHGHDRGHSHGGHGNNGGGSRSGSGGGCNCKMFSDLDDIEMAEKEELHRSLKRWQLSRRDIVSSICKN